jgi:EAL domain-containing protein (putative c-di-GMP-specific phosphodiesterase class I)
MSLLPPRFLPLRAIVIDGDEPHRNRTIALCRQLGLQAEGAATAQAGLQLLAAPHAQAESAHAVPRLAEPSGTEPHNVRANSVDLHAGMDLADLVLVDLNLPDMDCADLLQALAKQHSCFSLAFCSDAPPRFQDAARTLAASVGLPVLALLPKPLQLNDLWQVVDRIRPEGPSMAAGSKPAADDPLVLHAEEVRRGLLHGQFELHYQPKIALADHTLRGAEALLRWRHPRHGVLSPAHFLPQAEAAGLTGLLNATVLRLALDDWRRWQRAGLTLPLSINLSPRSLTDPDLADWLIGAVAAAGVPPASIIFEITEQSEIANLSAALRVLLKLRQHGFGLSLDDYGAGHASMLQLSRIPFTELKLDRGLIDGAWRRPHLLPLLRNTIAAAHEMGVATVAEGIESAPDWRLLRELGCELAQGYLIAKPMPAAALQHWQHARRPALARQDG